MRVPGRRRHPLSCECPCLFCEDAGRALSTAVCRSSPQSAVCGDGGGDGGGNDVYGCGRGSLDVCGPV